MEVQKVIKKWIEIDKNYSDLKFITEGKTCSPHFFNFIFEGKVVLEDKFWIYRILSKRECNKIMCILY